MPRRQITKRAVDSLRATGRDYFVWDRDLPGFGVRVRPSGAKSCVVQYRAGRGRKAPSRRMTIAAVAKLTPDEARSLAKGVVGDVARDDDPAADRTRKRREMTVREVAALYVADHVQPHNKVPSSLRHETYWRPEPCRNQAVALTHGGIAVPGKSMPCGVAPDAVLGSP